MNYFFDTEFLEGTQKKLFGQTKPTIDLISIGIVSEGGREFYAVSKDFNLKEAWNRYDEKVEAMSGDMRNVYPEGRKTKVYWIKENVLKPIWKELSVRYLNDTDRDWKSYQYSRLKYQAFNYSSLKGLINQYGFSNKQIAQGVFEFCTRETLSLKKVKYYNTSYSGLNIQFYGYYSSYDWVVFAWLFGKMIDLPNGFPMMCRDLKQTLDEKGAKHLSQGYGTHDLGDKRYPKNIAEAIENIKLMKDYPPPFNEHNALADAKWNFELYKFLQNI